jgi:hypothetical protein
MLGVYVSGAPTDQKSIDLFKGEWSSAFPATSGIQAGVVPLFEDARVAWAMEQLGGVEGDTVLELGPLEGGHTWMLEQAGARSIVAIEANSRAYLRCLITKEATGLSRCRFLLGDFLPYLRETENQFDLCFASGVLYHMRDPVELIGLIAEHADSLYLWTHYYEDRQPELMGPLRVAGTPGLTRGFQHTLYRRVYGGERNQAGFCGGPAEYSNWISRTDILRSLEHVGYEHVAVGFEEPDHPNGPALALVATR